MICDKCGIKVSDEAVFCYKCGIKLKKCDIKEIACSEELGGDTLQVNIIRQAVKETIEKDRNKALALDSERSISKISNDNKNIETTEGDKIPFYKNINIVMPLSASIFALILTFSCYLYELKVSKDVENLRVNAENLALQGKISEASSIVEKALNIRPNNKTLQADKKFLADGERVKAHISAVDDYVKKKDYNKALNELDKADKVISGSDGEIYTLFKKNIEDKRTGITVIQIKSEMNNKSSIKDLASLLTRIYHYNVKEAKDTSEELRKRISSVAYNDANELLKKSNFIAAIASVDEGLKYNPEDKKLTSFKEVIVNQKNSFEQAEQERLEQAMVAAAQEDKNNKTNAVEVIESNTEINKYGDFVIKGKIKNVATRPISSVQIYYAIYDENNNELGKGSTYVYPNNLNINDTGDFQNTEYGMVKGHHIKVTKITWSLR